jgi:hypothetical protein
MMIMAFRKIFVVETSEITLSFFGTSLHQREGASVAFTLTYRIHRNGRAGQIGRHSYVAAMNQRSDLLNTFEVKIQMLSRLRKRCLEERPQDEILCHRLPF